MAFVRLHDPVRGTQRELSLRKPLVSIGRAAGNDVQIDDATVEATHVNLIRRGNRYTLSIAQRGAEVYVNGRLKRKADLEYGDRILVGLPRQCPDLRYLCGYGVRYLYTLRYCR